jgi:hypothetical protein
LATRLGLSGYYILPLLEHKDINVLAVDNYGNSPLLNVFGQDARFLTVDVDELRNVVKGTL